MYTIVVVGVGLREGLCRDVLLYFPNQVYRERVVWAGRGGGGMDVGEGGVEAGEGGVGGLGWLGGRVGVGVRGICFSRFVSRSLLTALWHNCG
jgi:hypothetical protein